MKRRNVRAKVLPDRVFPTELANARTIVRRRLRQLDAALERLQLLQEELAARWAVSWTARLPSPPAPGSGLPEPTTPFLPGFEDAPNEPPALTQAQIDSLPPGVRAWYDLRPLAVEQVSP